MGSDNKIEGWCQHNMIMAYWELSLNMNLLMQLSEHPTVIFRGHIEQELNVE